MNPEKIPQLIAQIALADPRVRRDDPTEQRAQVAMWAGILADVPYDYAITAAHKHYAASEWQILPAGIATRWAATVRDRMSRDTGTFEPSQHPQLDPDDIPGYHAALRADRDAVRTGQRPPMPARAIAPDLTTDDVRAMKQQGDLIAHMKAASIQARAENERRRKLIARYPDLAARMRELPGHAQWRGSVGGNPHTRAIVEEAEGRERPAWPTTEA